MPHAVHTGVLCPATPMAAIFVFRDWPRLSSPHQVSGASALRVTCAYLATEPSSPPLSDELVSSPIAPSTVAKNTGAFTVLFNRLVDPPISSEPKLYWLAKPSVLSNVDMAAVVAFESPVLVPIILAAAASAAASAAFFNSPADQIQTTQVHRESHHAEEQWHQYHHHLQRQRAPPVAEPAIAQPVISMVSDTHLAP